MGLETFTKHFYVTTVSSTVLRYVSVLGGSGEPPEKFVKYLARYEYKLEIEFTEKEMNTYKVAVQLPVKEPTPPDSPQGDPDFQMNERKIQIQTLIKTLCVNSNKLL